MKIIIDVKEEIFDKHYKDINKMLLENKMYIDEVFREDTNLDKDYIISLNMIIQHRRMKEKLSE